MRRKRYKRKRSKNKRTLTAIGVQSIELSKADRRTIERALEESWLPECAKLLSLIRKETELGKCVSAIWNPSQTKSPGSDERRIRRREVFGVYSARNEILASLGYPSYQEYLESDLWASIRKRVFDGTDGACIRCRKPATQVHHSEYTKENLSGDSIDGLFVVCRRCHEEAEFTSDGRKASLAEANRYLLETPSSGEWFSSRPSIKAAIILPAQLIVMCAKCGERPPAIGEFCGWCSRTAHIS